MKKVTWFEFNRADDAKPFVSGYNEMSPSYTRPGDTIEDLYFWAKRLGAEKCKWLVADTAKKNIPKVGDIDDEEKPQPVNKDWIPFATKHHKMKMVKKVWPRYFLIHWTAGVPTQTGANGIEEGAKNGYTYLFLPRDGQVWQGAPTYAGGYHAGAAKVSSLDCLGIEVACAGKLEKIGDLYVPWFAKNSDGSINKARCIPQEEVIYDADGPEDDESFKGYYQLYTKEQRKSLTKLALYFCQELGGHPDRIQGHDMVAIPAGRKVDPGFSIGDGGMTAFRKEIVALLAKGIRWETI
jgi:hypothetical protein